MMSVGRLFSSPPSQSRCVPWSTGIPTPGSDELARQAFQRVPRRCTMTFAVVRLLDTQKNGSQRSSIATSPYATIPAVSNPFEFISERKGSV